MGKQVKRYLSLELLETFSANNFALSDAEDNNFGLLNRGSIVDSPLLRTLLAFCQKSQEPSFWKVMDSSFISICESGSFKNPFARINNLPEIYFRFRRFTLWVQMKKSHFYELWQQPKQLKTMEMSEAWSDTFDEGYIHQSQPEPTHKIH